MTRIGDGASEDLGRRSFGTAGGRKTPDKAPERPGEATEPREEILGEPILPPAPRAWKPRSGRIYNFPVRRVMEEK